ncbi:MAG TPA: putative sulfate exporter family transporter [Anaerolineae bacterium]
MKSIVQRYTVGVALSIGLAVAAVVLQLVETQVLGQPVIEGIVIAILLGMLVRTFVPLGNQFAPGISFSAKQVLEFAVVLLGVSIDLPSLLKAGPIMMLSIIMVVCIGIFASMQIGRLLGLNQKLAILVACGNSICGNSAIAAVAPVIGAEKKDIASSIALTAVLGVVVVLTLPLLIRVASLSLYQYGVLAGMTVYAVPQVIAATYPVSVISGDVGTLVKLVRVLMLGPVVLFFSLRFRGMTGAANPTSRFSLNRFVPWFIIGFVALATLRSLGLIPSAVADPLREVSRYLTVIAMAALGLGVDIRQLRVVGRPVALAVIGSLAVLLILSLTLIKGFGIA